MEIFTLKKSHKKKKIFSENERKEVKFANSKMANNERKCVKRLDLLAMVQRRRTKSAKPRLFSALFTLTILLTTLQNVKSQAVMNRPPFFVSGQDMTRFSLSENTPVNTPIYQLRGTVT